MTESDRGGARRTAVGLRLRVGCASVDELVRRFAPSVSGDGFFVRTAGARPPGTELAFELLLTDGTCPLRGRGVVRSASADGMGVQFTDLDAASRALVDRMLALKAPGSTSTSSTAPTLTPTPTPAPRQSEAEAMAGGGTRTPSQGGDPTSSLGGEGAASPRENAAPAGRGRREPPATQSSTTADLRAAHAVQRLVAGPAPLEVGLPQEPRPVAHPSRHIIGIDLGTTNSCAAVVKDGKPYVIPSREGWNTVPSIVALNARHRLVVGHLARAQLLVNPADTVHGAKRLVGRPWDSKAVQQCRENFAYRVVEGEEGLAAVELAGRRLSLEQVSALVLKEVKEVAQNHLGEEVNRAVITVPAYYNERQREAVRRAGALAGFQVERIVNEPTAAALAYAYGRCVRQRVLVYDLGGGTFDASVLELQDTVYEVVSTGGDTFLGGVDFDQRIVARLLERFEEQAGQPFDGDRVALSRLADAAERAKCELSERQEHHIQLPFLAMKDGQPLALDVILTRAELSALVEPLVERTLQVCREVLAARQLTPQDLDEIILVGGQSRMPLVHERVQAFFGRTPSRAVHPDEAVAIGAALLAHTLGSAEGIVLIDVLPLSICIALPSGGVRPVFERNTPLPARKQYGLATTRDGQTEFELVVVQGEAPTAEGCEYLGTVRLDGLPSGPRGMVKIAVGLELGPEGLLTVTARELQTNRSVKTSFSARPGRASARNGAARSGPDLVTSSVSLPLPGPAPALAAPAPAAPPAGKRRRSRLAGLWGRLFGGAASLRG